MKLLNLAVQILEDINSSDASFRIDEVIDKVITWRAKLVRDAIKNEPSEASRYTEILFGKMAKDNPYIGIETDQEDYKFMSDILPRSIIIGSTPYQYFGTADGREPYGYMMSSHFHDRRQRGLRYMSPKYTIESGRAIVDNVGTAYFRVDVIPADPRELLSWDSYRFNHRDDIEIEENLVSFLRKYVRSEMLNIIPDRQEVENDK